MSSVTVDPSVLHALRICGFAAATRVADYLGLPLEATEARLREGEQQGLVRFRDGRVSGWSLTPSGKQAHGSQLATGLPQGTARSQVTSGYEAFLAHNRELKQICTDWQLRMAPDGTAHVNDHCDHEYDTAVVDRLGGHHTSCEPMFDQLGDGLSRLSGYRSRLDAALQRLREGDHAAFATPMSASYHCVWMELHQDLLLTLGRERDEADGH
jgi:hypothetical protein